MSVCLPPSLSTTASASFDPPPQRKRTSSFSRGAYFHSPRPLKSARTCITSAQSSLTMTTLKRADSYIFLPPLDGSSPVLTHSAPHHDGSSVVPFARSMRYYKEQREHRKAHLRRRDQSEFAIHTRLEPVLCTAGTPPLPSISNSDFIPPPQTPTIPFAKLPTGAKILLAQTHADATVERISGKNSSLRHSQSLVAPTPIRPPLPPPSIAFPQPAMRMSSPLAPVQRPLPPRPKFPRSKNKEKTDLLRRALRGQMRSTPEGRRIMSLGPQASLSVVQATSELAELVALAGSSPDLGDEDMELDFEEEDLTAAEEDTDADADGEVDDGAVMGPAAVPRYFSHTSTCAPELGNSWVCVPNEDWEMIDPTA